ncbi:MAG: ribosomal small subunit protein bTHX [Chitinophagales bacterium]|jgi:ribosomal small subunit protein bTHX
MGRGDKKTKRGKISQGSWGVSRPKRPVILVAPAKKKKAKAKTKVAAKK